MVAAQVAAGPSRLAVVDGDRALTYAALGARANLLANHLRRHGAGPDRAVALVLPRSADLVIAALATLRAGAACVPVDPALPVERVADVLADAEPCVVVTRRGLVDRMSRGSWRVVALDRDRAEIGRQSTSPPATACEPSDLAYLVYGAFPFAGSRPNRIEITHGNLLNRVIWQHAAVRVTPADRAPLLSRAGFEAAVRETWPYLTAGASLHVPDDVTCLDSETLRDWLVAQDMTIAFVTSPMAERLVALPWPAARRLRALLTSAEIVRHRPSPGSAFARGWEALADRAQVVHIPADHHGTAARQAGLIARARHAGVAGAADAQRGAA